LHHVRAFQMLEWYIGR